VVKKVLTNFEVFIHLRSTWKGQVSVGSNTDHVTVLAFIVCKGQCVIIVGKLTCKNQIEIKTAFFTYCKRDSKYLRWYHVHASKIFLEHTTYPRARKSTEYD
jgi:predicted nucleic acid-binding Zn finger protein